MPYRPLRVLWVEDKTQLELAYLIPPVLLDGHYDLEIAHNASEVVERLGLKVQHPFDILIFDLDIPPGEWPEFKDLYTRFEPRGQGPAMLGLELLYLMRRGEGRHFKGALGTLMKQMHTTYRHVPIGVFSIYTKRYEIELAKLLNLTRAECQHRLVQKHAGMPRTTLLRLVRHLSGFVEG